MWYDLLCWFIKRGKKVAGRSIAKIVDDMISRAINLEIKSDVDFDDEQFDALQSLAEYCVRQVLGDIEVIKDPRKIFYKSSQELKLALIAMCLSQSLNNPYRKASENKEFFNNNITIELRREDNSRFISFGKINDEHVKDAIFWDIIEDWKIYRDREGFGIKALVDDKTNLIGLKDYERGGDPLYEFARFQRKYTERERKKEEKARESAQEAFRNAMVQTLAVEAAKQQLLEGKNPMDLVELLFAPNSPRNKREVKRISNDSKKQKQIEVDAKVQEDIMLLLEYGPKPDDED